MIEALMTPLNHPRISLGMAACLSLLVSTGLGADAPASALTQAAQAAVSPVPQKPTQSATIKGKDSDVTINVFDYTSPLAVAPGTKLPAATAPWAEALGESLPAMASSYEKWKANTTPDLASRIALTEDAFNALVAKGYLGHDSEYLYHFEAEDKTGKRMLFLVGRSEVVKGAGKANFMKLFSWNGTKWLSAASDELNLLGKISMTNRERLRDALNKAGT
ncbi:MAG: hypothetical protein RL693_1611 [Verrucomicrobiota bacterium]|jgi:hypothetical protein